MSIVNEEDFFGRIEHEFGEHGKVDASKEEQRQYENLALENEARVNEIFNEFGVPTVAEYIAALKCILLDRNRSRSLGRCKNLSTMKMKKISRVGIAIGVISEFFYSEIVGMTSEATGNFHDELRAMSSRFYNKDVELLNKQLSLTSAAGSPTIGIVSRHYRDAVGNLLQYKDWMLEVRDGNRVRHYELTYPIANEAVTGYLLLRDETCANDNWSAWVDDVRVG